MSNAYPLSQDLGQLRDSLRYTEELVEAGYCPLVYPEGRLTPDGSLQPFQPGIGLMSLRLEVPGVPVYLHGLFDVMSLHDSRPRGGPSASNSGRLSFPARGKSRLSWLNASKQASVGWQLASRGETRVAPRGGIAPHGPSGFCSKPCDTTGAPARPPSDQQTGKKMSVRHFDWSGSVPGSVT